MHGNFASAVRFFLDFLSLDHAGERSLTKRQQASISFRHLHRFQGPWCDQGQTLSVGEFELGFVAGLGAVRLNGRCLARYSLNVPTVGGGAFLNGATREQARRCHGEQNNKRFWQRHEGDVREQPSLWSH